MIHRLSAISLLGLACALSFVVGRATGTRQAETKLETTLGGLDERIAALTRSRDRDCWAAVATAGLDKGATANDIERAVARAIANAQPPHAADREDSTGAGSPDTKPKPLTPEVQASAARGRDLLAAAVQRRHWTEADAATFRTVLGALDGERLWELRGELIRLINDDRLTIDYAGSPFWPPARQSGSTH